TALSRMDCHCRGDSGANDRTELLSAYCARIESQALPRRMLDGASRCTPVRRERPVQIVFGNCTDAFSGLTIVTVAVRSSFQCAVAVRAWAGTLMTLTSARPAATYMLLGIDQY